MWTGFRRRALQCGLSEPWAKAGLAFRLIQRVTIAPGLTGTITIAGTLARPGAATITASALARIAAITSRRRRRCIGLCAEAACRVVPEAR